MILGSISSNHRCAPLTCTGATGPLDVARDVARDHWRLLAANATAAVVDLASSKYMFSIFEKVEHDRADQWTAACGQALRRGSC